MSAGLGIVTPVVWKFWPHQRTTIYDTTSAARSIVSGFSGGKTYALVRWAIIRAIQNPAGSVVLLISPKWLMSRRVIVPELVRALDELGVQYSVNKTDLTFSFIGRHIWLGSGDKPLSLSGTTVACAGIDEPAIQDEEVDRRVVSRVRDPRASIRQILYTGTHEGLGWFYRRSQKIPTITVPMWFNRSLTQDTIDRQKERFHGDEVRFKMYVEGQAMALSGGIYTCCSDANLRRCTNPTEGETVVGFDFNVGFMCTPICRVLDDEIHVFTEVISTNTTTENHCDRLVAFLKERRMGTQRHGQFGLELVGHDGKRIDAWIDASGDARKTSATRTDRSIVKDSGFFPRSPASNPLVRDRVEIMQSALKRKRLFIDPDGAPFTCRAVKEHAYAKGSDPPEPQKRWREGEEPLDAATDSLGYVVCGIHGVSRTSWRSG